MTTAIIIVALIMLTTTKIATTVTIPMIKVFSMVRSLDPGIVAGFGFVDGDNGTITVVLVLVRFRKAVEVMESRSADEECILLERQIVAIIADIEMTGAACVDVLSSPLVPTQ